MMSTISGHGASKHALTRAEGMGSREQVEGFVNETISDLRGIDQ